jgi:DNA-binding GntR family transcriptional regulator
MSSITSTISQRDQAYQSLRRLLILQKMPEGERLREPEWSERLKVNRTALREAFARLEAEGLVVRGPATGYFVPELTEQDIDEIVRIRAMLECGAIEQFLDEREDLSARLEPLVAACDEFESFLRSGYMLGVSEADRRFHEALIDAAGNRRLTAIYRRAPLPLIHLTVVSDEHFAKISREVLAEHRAIIAAIRAGDAAKAQKLLRRHLSERSQIPLHG